MRLWCFLFGHKLNPPVRNSRGSKSHMTCRRCSVFLLPDYFNGWRPASKSEKRLRLAALARRTGEDAMEQPAE